MNLYYLNSAANVKDKNGNISVDPSRHAVCAHTEEEAIKKADYMKVLSVAVEPKSYPLGKDWR